MPELRPGTNHCQCGGCGLYFQTVKAFDRHRIGVGLNRGCLPQSEMAANSLHRDAQGFYRLPVKPGPKWAEIRPRKAQD